MADRLELQRIASAFRVVGWGAFWSQLTLALVSAGVLAFNSIGSELVSNRDKAIGLGPGLSLTTLALLILAWGVAGLGPGAHQPRPRQRQQLNPLQG